MIAEIGLREGAMADAAILVIGNEILSGRTRDANVAFLGAELAQRGIALAEVRIVRDEEPAIIAALDALRAAYTYVFTSGGIGPTHDDITAAAVARAFGRPLVEDAEAVRRLEERSPGQPLNAARRKMATIPAGASLIDNPVSAAPGFRVGNVFVLAGVPAILQAMWAALAPQLERGPALAARQVVMAVREGDLAQPLALLQGRHPTVELGSYPSFGAEGPRVAVVARGTDPAQLDRVEAELRALAHALGAPLLDG